MFDRRPAAMIEVEAHLFKTKFSDEDKEVEIQVNPEFSKEEAEAEAKFYGHYIGRIPISLRTKLETVWIHRGKFVMGGGSNNFLIHTDMGKEYLEKGELDASFLHEGVHTSLDPDHLNTEEWQGAIVADGCSVSPYAKKYPQREDMAETFAAWFMVRHRKNQVEPALYDKICSKIPHRLAYYDKLNLDLSPNYSMA